MAASSSYSPYVSPLNKRPNLARQEQRKQLYFDDKVRRIKHLFNNILMQQRRDNFINFPSVKALAGQFDATEKDIYQALEDLRLKGFDYEIIASRETIRVWEVPSTLL